LGFVFLSLFALLCLAVNYWVFVRQHDARQEAEAMNHGRTDTSGSISEQT
jgi:hypothetical protein